MKGTSERMSRRQRIAGMVVAAAGGLVTAYGSVFVVVGALQSDEENPWRGLGIAISAGIALIGLLVVLVGYAIASRRRWPKVAALIAVAIFLVEDMVTGVLGLLPSVIVVVAVAAAVAVRHRTRRESGDR